jgi:hypothetical protein
MGARDKEHVLILDGGGLGSICSILKTCNCQLTIGCWSVGYTVSYDIHDLPYLLSKGYYIFLLVELGPNLN